MCCAGSLHNPAIVSNERWCVDAGDASESFSVPVH